MFKKVPLEKFYRLINHGPCVLITSGDEKRSNFAPIAWTMPVNDEPPLCAIAVAETHFTAELIKETKTFAVNVMAKKYAEDLVKAGKIKGKEKDKYKETGFTAEKGITIATPHLSQASAFLECKLRQTLELDGVCLFVGEILNASVNDSVFDEYWITEKAEIVHHLGGNHFACLGKRFKA